MSAIELEPVMTEDCFVKTNHLSTPAEYIPCLYVDPQMLFDQIVLHVDELINGNCLKFHTIDSEGNQQTPEPLRQYLPFSADESFQTYHQRINGMINSGESMEKVRYQVQINYLETFSSVFRDWMVKFYEPIFEEMGLSRGINFSSIFLGDYKATSFGIHFDDEFVFHIPFVGKKQMKLWDGRKHKIEEIRSDKSIEGRVISATSGSCVFWTPNYYHVSTTSKYEFVVSCANASRVMVPFDEKIIMASFFLKFLPTTVWLWLTNRKSIKSRAMIAYTQAWWDFLEKRKAKIWGFRQPESLSGIRGRKTLVKTLARHQSKGVVKTDLRKKEPDQPERLRYRLLALSEPLIYFRNPCNYIALNGHVYPDADTVQQLLQKFKESPDISWPKDDQKMTRALLWLYKIRAVSVAA